MGGSSPATRFWSVTVYDNPTRSMTMNRANKEAVTSYDDIRLNRDGSVDLCFAPEAPEGLESIWVDTSASEGWFVWFRFYGPMQTFFDKSWQWPDFEKNKRPRKASRQAIAAGRRDLRPIRGAPLPGGV